MHLPVNCGILKNKEYRDPHGAKLLSLKIYVLDIKKLQNGLIKNR